MKRRVRLNPCDTLFFAHHSMMQREGHAGNLPFMIMDLDGEIDPDRLRAGVARCIDAHPVIRSRARLSVLTQWPYWETVATQDRPATRHFDLRGEPDWQAQCDDLAQDHFAAGWDMTTAPQVCLEHYRGPQDRTRLCLRWPHALMDAEGAQWFMHEVNRLDASADAAPPAALKPSDLPSDPLADAGWRQRVALFRRGIRGYQPFGRVDVGGLADGPAEGRWRFLHRGWSGTTLADIRRCADTWCPAGPARFSRYLGACVLRALHRMYRERAADTDAYLVTLPMKVRGLPAGRPLTGNYLVSMTLCARRETVEDKRRLLDELGQQVAAFLARDGDRASWAMIWMMGLLRQWQYRRILAWSTQHQPYTSGLSHYGEIDPPLRTFLGARVLNFWGCSNTAIPPGWNPAFSRFGDHLNLSLAWLDGYYRRETAVRYTDLIEAELLDPECP